MRSKYIGLMDKLYLLCVTIAVLSVIAMTILIAIGVFMRWFLGKGAVFSEPMSIFFAIQLSFYGAAACYRAGAHLHLEMFTKLLPDKGRYVTAHLVHLLMAGIASFMVYYGTLLVITTFGQSYPEFMYVEVLKHVTVGVVYTAIPASGLITLLFVIEKVLFGDDVGVPVATIGGGGS